MLRVIWIALALAGAALAQETDTGVGQLAGFLGAISGVGGSHWAGGVNFGVPTTKHLVPNIEFGMSTLNAKGYRVVEILENTSVLQRARLYDLDAGVRVRFPNRTHAVPYLAIGAALLDFTASIQSSTNGQMTNIHHSTYYVAPAVGAGISYYINNHLGIRPEIKGYFSSHKFARLAVGVFYQFP